MFLNTFGTPVLLNESGELLLPRGKPLALLAYCAADRHRTISRDECAALLWSDMPADRARHSVRQVIWRFRRILGDALITRDDLISGIGAGVVSDREQFLESVYGDNADLALRLYAPPFLDGLVLPGGQEFTRWVHFERRRLEEALVQVVERAVHSALARAQPGEAFHLADRLLERAPTHRTAHRLVMHCAMAAGEQQSPARFVPPSTALRRDDTLPQLVVVARPHVQEPPRGDEPSVSLVRPASYDGVEPPPARGIVPCGSPERLVLQLLAVADAPLPTPTLRDAWTRLAFGTTGENATVIGHTISAPDVDALSPLLSSLSEKG